MDDQLYAFAFRGLLTEEALDAAGRQTKLAHPRELTKLSQRV